MPNEFREAKSFKIAFVLDETLLRDMATMLTRDVSVAGSGHDGESMLQYELEFKAGSSFRTDDLDAVLAQPNSGDRMIESITVGTKFWVTPRVYLRFTTYHFSNSVSYNVSGDERDVFFTSSRVEEFIRRTRIWYSRLAHLDVAMYLSMTVTAVIAAASLLLVVLGLAGYLQDVPPASSRTAAVANGAVFAGVVLLFGVGVVLNRIRRWLFPTGVVAIGDERGRPERLKFWRTFFGCTIIAAVVVNIGTSLLMS